MVRTKLVPGENDLATLRPDLAAEFNLSRNSPLEPSCLHSNSNKRVWWICKRGHEWQTSPSNRGGCPACPRNNFKSQSVAFGEKYPDLLKEWDAIRNLGLLPNELSVGSKQKIWWKCSFGHSFEAAVQSRTIGGGGCPYCSGRKVLVGFNDLQTKFPAIAAEWNFDKNGDLLPEDFTPGSKAIVWWVCPLGHEYQTMIQSRTSKKQIRCGVCSGRLVVAGVNDISTTHPFLIEIWDSELNLVHYSTVSYGMKSKFWWKCSGGHSYQKAVGWAIRGSGCSVCSKNSSQVLSGLNDLATQFPDLVREIHPTLNEGFDPTTIRASSSVAGKIWWLCQEGHSYKASLGNRTSRKSGCPFCSKTGFNPESPGILYLLSNSELKAMKIGITGVLAKTNRLRAFVNAGWQVTRTWKFEKGANASELEAEVLYWLRGVNAGSFKFVERGDLGGMSGHTEVFAAELVKFEEILRFVDDKSRELRITILESK